MDKFVTIEEYQQMWHKMAMYRLGLPDDEYGGIKFFKGMAKTVDKLQTWTVREDDVWVVTYLKAGTTWAQEITSCVMHDGDLDAVKKRHAAFRVPFLEHNLPEELRRQKNLPETHKVLDDSPSARLIKTHLPGNLLPAQLWTKKPKIIYVIRNPKDLVVSAFHFSKISQLNDRIAGQQFEEFSREMMAGTTHYGPWWDHYLYFWKRRHDDNILILRFEDMKRDLRGNVEKICRFLGKSFSDVTLDAITEHCSFTSMKNNRMSNLDGLFFKHTDQQQGAMFMRKGIVGDWKTHFTVEHNEVMDEFIKEKLRGTGLTFDYN